MATTRNIRRRIPKIIHRRRSKDSPLGRLGKEPNLLLLEAIKNEHRRTASTVPQSRRRTKKFLEQRQRAVGRTRRAVGRTRLRLLPFSCRRKRIGRTRKRTIRSSFRRILHRNLRRPPRFRARPHEQLRPRLRNLAVLLH